MVFIKIQLSIYSNFKYLLETNLSSKYYLKFQLGNFIVSFQVYIIEEYFQFYLQKESINIESTIVADRIILWQVEEASIYLFW